MSMFGKSGLVVALVTASLSLSGCTGTGIYAKGYYSVRDHWGSPAVTVTESSAGPASSTTPSTHTVAQGETLYSIAFQFGYDYRQVASWNGIKSPFTIYPGQSITFKSDAEEPSDDDQPVTPEPAVPKGRVIAKGHSETPAARTNVNLSNAVTNDSVQWVWPTRGRVARTYLNTDPGRRGIDLSGQFGQPVMAAASGQVVYSGSGLRGYGKLIIVKHSDTYFSAYAHNKKIYVKENETIKIGQRIADMGKDEGGQTYLHFEIRRNGVPVNPLKYLPKQRP